MAYLTVECASCRVPLTLPLRWPSLLDIRCQVVAGIKESAGEVKGPLQPVTQSLYC